MSYLNSKAQYLYDCLEKFNDKYKMFLNEQQISVANICLIEIYDEYYKIKFVDDEWSKKTSYLVETNDKGWKYFYNVDSVDECVYEIKRLIDFIFRRYKNEHISELSKLVTEDRFKEIYSRFIAQADINAKTGKSQGSKLPYGITKAENHVDGASVAQHFGQGAATKTPYFNWWVVSIYYLPDSENIILGIEDDRYEHINEMTPTGHQKIGNKDTSVAVFYSTTKTNLDYSELYEKFICTAEEVMRLGVTDKNTVQLVENISDLRENMNTIDLYLSNTESPNYDFAVSLIKKGTCFLVVDSALGFKFYPSRFVGYKNNTCENHKNNNHKDGSVTNQRINLILSGVKPEPNIELEQKYEQYCSKLGIEIGKTGSFGVQRKFWLIDE